MNSHFHIPYAIPTLLLAVAVAFRVPTFLRAWRDAEVRATTLLLLCATAVLVVITPVNIDRLNRLTGVPNIASPWAYSFLTASCATGLAMIIRWREPPSRRRRRTIRRLYGAYAGVVAALWTTFWLADAPVPRIYDLDTYYATTPWMREHILLYLLAHLASCFISTRLLWKWFTQIANPWLKTGVVFLQLGYAAGLVFDAAKLTAVTARWTGTDWDALSTRAAPPFALAQATLLAVGFIVPQAGPALTHWARDRAEYRRLGPLWRTVKVLAPAAAKARIGFWSPLDLRLLQRRQRIHDALRVLASRLDHGLYERAHRTAAATRGEAEAHGLAGAVAVLAAVDAYRAGDTGADARADEAGPAARPTGTGADLSDHIDAVSLALRHPRTVDGIRRRATSTESLNVHV
ncbi:MAB_1171c family putative transporter [Streptomyces sp. NPDC018610]|uniref:MAB_1171c family putative transporter n=1 Tax=Streptomyces sp. NPDC018610 TaxID=3365049 RepID=UPI0037AD4AFF